MNINDFRYLWRGKTIQGLSSADADLLQGINHQTGHKKRALLLLHGFSSSPAVYRELIPDLINLYDAVVCPVLPGHGESLEAFAKANAQQWFLAAEQALEHLIKNYSAVDVMGLSLGGVLACHLSHLFPIRHLYLLAPALVLRLNLAPSLKLARILKRLGFQYLRNHAGNLFTRRSAELAYRQLPIASIIEILTVIHEFKFNPPPCPADVFLGKFDKVIDSERVEKLFANRPNTNIHWLDQSAHVLPLDGDIDTILARVKDNF